MASLWDTLLKKEYFIYYFNNVLKLETKLLDFAEVTSHLKLDNNQIHYLENLISHISLKEKIENDVVFY